MRGGKPVENDFCGKSGFYSICRKEEFVPKEVPVGRCFVILKIAEGVQKGLVHH